MVKKILIAIGILVLLGGGYGLYKYLQPPRDVQKAKVDVVTTTKALVAEYLKNKDAANKKYLSSDGDSKIFAISGKVSSISENAEKAKVIKLKEDGGKVAISCTFTLEATKTPETAKLKEGDMVTIKGQITTGPEYDKDFEEYSDIVMIQCALKPADKK